MAPNLFDYANNERSQDGMICWLIAWAGESKSESESEEDKKLRRCGRRFVEALLNHKRGHEKPIELKGQSTVKILQQARINGVRSRIDVLARIEDKHVLLIEDKIDTMDRDGQLSDYYRHVVEGHTELGKVNPGDLYPVYIKTGNQPLKDDCRIEGIEEYKVFNRKHFLDVLDGCEGCNSTLRDFRRRLQEWEAETNSYVQWTQGARRESRHAWEGFYRRLECGWADTSRRVWWGHVPNPAGGFRGFAWGPQASELYLQIEAPPGNGAKLCFKVWAEGKSKEQQQVLKFGWHDRVMNSGKGLVFRTQVLRIGNTMTVAWWKEEWMAFGHDDKLDVSRTVENLKRAEEVLNEAIREGQIEQRGTCLHSFREK